MTRDTGYQREFKGRGITRVGPHVDSRPLSYPQYPTLCDPLLSPETPCTGLASERGYGALARVSAYNIVLRGICVFRARRVAAFDYHSGGGYKKCEKSVSIGRCRLRTGK